MNVGSYKATLNNKVAHFLSIHPFIAEAFLQKSPLTVQRFFYFLYGDFYTTASPFIFKEMQKAVDLIHNGCQQKQTFYIVGDKDADGVTSISILKIFLEKLGATVYYNLPLNGESYGFSERIYKDILDKKENLCCVITVDCGIKEHYFIEQLAENGIKTVLTDHHKLDAQEIPKAYATINPHLYEKEFFPLCGGALSFKLAQAIYLSYTSYYKKKIMLILPSFNKEGYNIGMCQDIYSPIQESSFVTHMDGNREVRKYLQDDAYMIFTTQEIVTQIEDSMLGKKSEQVVIVEELYKQYTQSTLQFQEIIKRESIYSYSNNNLFPFSLLIRKIISKYHLHLEEKLSFFIEYMSVSLICDRMDMNHPETHSIIKIGLHRLVNNKDFSPLKLLFNNENLYFDIEKTVAIQIGPILNAPGRLGKANEVVDFLVSKNETEALSHLDRLKKLNQERQKIQQNGLKEISTYLELFKEESERSIILYASETIEQGVTGVLANNISKLFNKPCIIIAINKEKGTATGSGRTQSRALHPILEPINDLFLAFGGHNKACGFTIPIEKLDLLKEHIISFDLESIKDHKENESYIVELENFGLINNFFITSLEKLEPFGESHPKPLFRSQITLKEIIVFGKEENHLKLKAQENLPVDIIFWKKAELYDTLKAEMNLTIVYNLTYNLYRNGVNAIIHEYEIS